MSFIPVPNIFAARTAPIPLSQLDADLSYISGKVRYLDDFSGIPQDATTDASPAIQAAINASYGYTLIIPPRQFLLNSGLSIRGVISLVGTRAKSIFLMGTPNMTGVTFGNGSHDQAENSSVLDSIMFLPKPGIAASVTGECVKLNCVTDIKIRHCIFYGLDGGVRKLFNGVSYIQTTNCDIERTQFYSLAGNVFTGVGAPGLANRVVDCRLDYIQAYDCLNGLLFNDYCAGINICSLIYSSSFGYGIKINTSLYNFFIQQPDMEVPTGIWVAQGSGVVIDSGWIGGGSVALQVDATASGVRGSNMLLQSTGGVVINGPACELASCDVVGDNATSATGITVGGAQFLMTGGAVRQFTVEGIKFVGSPVQCELNGVRFANNPSNVTGDAYAEAPQIRDCLDSSSPFIAAASTLPVRHGWSYVNVTGATAVNVIPAIGRFSKLVVQAGAGGITLNNSAGLSLRGGVNAAIPAGSAVELVCTGTAWFEMSRNF